MIIHVDQCYGFLKLFSGHPIVSGDLFYISWRTLCVNFFLLRTTMPILTKSILNHLEGKETRNVMTPISWGSNSCIKCYLNAFLFKIIFHIHGHRSYKHIFWDRGSCVQSFIVKMHTFFKNLFLFSWA